MDTDTDSTAHAGRRRRRRGRVTVAGGVTAALAACTVAIVVLSTGPRAGGAPIAPSVASPRTAGGTERLRTVPPATGRLVRNRGEVLGMWTVVEVRGGPPPADAVPGLQIRSRGTDRLELSWDDSVNWNYLDTAFESDGRLDRAGGLVGSTLVGCRLSGGRRCERPSGFGVSRATRLNLTDAGELVLVGPGGGALAVYRRVG